MSISCYIIIQIVSEEIYFLKGSLFKAGEAKIRRASCVLLRAHACPERGQTSTELLSTLSSRLYSPQPRVAFSDERFPVQIQLPRQEDQRMRSHVQALLPLGQWASRRGLVPGSPVSAGRFLGDRSGWWAHSFMFDF